MTRFTVVWIEDARNELTELWLNSVDRQAVRDAADSVDRELRDNPTHKGHPVSEGIFSLNIAPLRLLFTVSEGDRVVEVLRVTRI